MITITGLRKSFGARDLFRDADLQVGARDRVALVGPNGSGKTTLLEMIAGAQEYDAGQIQIARGAVVGYLPQETDALRGRTVLQEMLARGTDVTDAKHRLALLEAEMAEAAADERDRLVAEYGRLQERFQALGGYSLEAQAKKILAGLGFSDEDYQRPTDSLSGGWLMRVALAKLLLANPDILMLDEPTNHLDVPSVEWLERFLGAYEGSILLISHDRDFIDAIATKVVEISESRLVGYVGDYEDFVRQREAHQMQLEAAAKNQARKVAQTERFIARFRYKASKAKQVQSRIKSLERLDRVDATARRAKKMNLSFPQPERAGRVVLELRDVSFAYGDNVVYDKLNFVVERDQKVALVGPNGAGKTTLLKLTAGALEPKSGDRVLGHKVTVGYFAQHQVEALSPAKTVLEELQGAIPPKLNLKPRDLLGRFMFSGDDVDKPVSVLSGGEKSRLALAKLLVTAPNVLCLDEPTNHLDMQSRDVLEDALQDFTGAIVLITHDRHLIRSIANRVVEIAHGNLTDFAGGFDYYVSKREPIEEPESESKPRSGPTAKERRRAQAEARARTSEARKKLARIETELDEVSAELTRISTILADPASYTEGHDIAELSQAYERARKRSQKLEAMWEEAASAIEAASS